MPITILDLILLVIMLISALLAMVRGFMREILSIVSWVVAALAAYFALPRLSPWAKQFFGTLGDTAVSVIVGGSVFLLTLLIVSILTVRISDMVLDSRIGALDRTLGFVFGLARGLIIVVVAFAFFAWLVPEFAANRIGCAAQNRRSSCRGPKIGWCRCCRMTPKTSS